MNRRRFLSALGAGLIAAGLRLPLVVVPKVARQPRATAEDQLLATYCMEPHLYWSRTEARAPNGSPEFQALLDNEMKSIQRDLEENWNKMCLGYFHA